MASTAPLALRIMLCDAHGCIDRIVNFPYVYKNESKTASS